MERRFLNLLLVLQVLLLQFLQCRCPAHPCAGSRPHVHLGSHGFPKTCHFHADHEHEDEAPAEEDGPTEGEHRQDAVELPDGLHASRTEPAPFVAWAISLVVALVPAPLSPVIGHRPPLPCGRSTGPPLYLRLLALLI